MHKVYKAFRLLAEIRMIAGIEVITDKHIKHGRSLVEQFGKLLPVCLKVPDAKQMLYSDRIYITNLWLTDCVENPQQEPDVSQDPYDTEASI
jgi:hypothetical protein